VSDPQQPVLPKAKQVVIDSFRFEFGFLSNFHEASIWMGGKRYPSVEHAYQSLKVGGEETIREAKTPAIAKKLGRTFPMVPDWDSKKVDVMRTLLEEKFKNPLLRSMLLATEDAELIEGNTWNDTFWGICRGKGQNWLGRLLMEVREKCKREERIEA
jgi:N-glycosidase YbiA